MINLLLGKADNIVNPVYFFYVTYLPSLLLLFQLLGQVVPWLAAGVAVGGAIFMMERTHSVHPPGGATALVAVIGSADIHR